MGTADDRPSSQTPSLPTDLAGAWSPDALTRSFSATATGSPVDAPFLFSAGQRFGPYQIVRPLGKGGMGQVYEAEESDSGRRVAIKILSRGIGDEEDRERFLGEGRLAAAWPPPSSTTSAPSHALDRDFGAAQHFLYVIALSALRGSPAALADPLAIPLPLPARTLLLSLQAAAFKTPQAMASEAASVLRTPAVVTRGRRAIQLAACGAFPLFVSGSIAVGVTFMQRLIDPDSPVMRLSLMLDRIAELNRIEKRRGQTPDTTAERESLEVYVATDLRSTVQDPETWLKTSPSIGVKPGHRAEAEHAVSAYRSASQEQVAAARAFASGFFAGQRKEAVRVQSEAMAMLGRITIVALAGCLAMVGCIGLVGAFVARGGFTLRLFGAAVVRRDGREVSRLRTLVRAALAWLPAAIMPVAHVLGLQVSMASRFGAVPSLVGVLILTGGGVWALMHPSRGLQDRLVGTWLVPRQ